MDKIEIYKQYYRAVSAVIGAGDKGEKDSLQDYEINQSNFSLNWFYRAFDKILNDERREILRALFLSEELEKNDMDLKISDLGELNESQKMALTKALNSRVTIIQGPPGTGKTQVILHILKQIIENGKNAAVVSSNNSAIDNVYEKSQNFGIKDKIAMLGNKEKRKKFFGHYEAKKDYSDSNFLIPNNTVTGWDMLNEAKDFLSKYPIILSTFHSLLKCFVDGDDFLYDYVIIDEASQSDLIAGLVAVSVAKNIILLGDDEQLPAIFAAKNIPKIEKLLDEIVPDKFLEVGEDRSLLWTFSRKFRDSQIMLNEHYRCHEAIINFCNEYIYDKKLKIKTNKDKFYTKNIKMPIRVLWYDGDYSQYALMDNLPLFNEKNANSYKSSKINLKQIEVFQKEELPYLVQKLKETKNISVCILTPYRGQLALIKDRIKNAIKDTEIAEEYEYVECENNEILSLTIHKSQGREFDLVYLLPVDDGDWEWPWSQKKRLVNVAVSRAKQELRIVLSSSLMSENLQKELNGYYIKPKKSNINSDECGEHFIQLLCDYVYEKSKNLKENGYGFVKSKICSIFDQNAFEKQNAQNKNIKINSIAEEIFYKNFPLNLLEKYDLALQRQCNVTNLIGFKEIKNHMQSFDFVLYEKNSKKVLTCIEIDGFQHQYGNSKQKDLDKTKDELFENIGCKIIKSNVLSELENLDENNAKIVLFRLSAYGSSYGENSILRKNLPQNANKIFTIDEIVKKLVKIHKNIKENLVTFKEKEILRENEADILIKWLKERGVKYFVHFTPVSNLDSILKKGLLPRDKIKTEYTDEYRRDDHTDRNCLSISYINFKMFYNILYRRGNVSNEKNKFAILLIDIDIIKKLGVQNFYFYPTNAANEQSIEYDNLQGLQALKAMFDDVYYIENEKFSRSDENMPDFATTDPQAEVQVSANISPKYIQAIVVNNEKIYNELKKKYQNLDIKLDFRYEDSQKSIYDMQNFYVKFKSKE